MRLFDPNGGLMSTLGKLSDIVICNIMFCVCCLPVVTIGAAGAALYSVMQDLIDDKVDDLVFRVYWNAFRKNFKQAAALWGICLGAIAFLFFFYQVIRLLGGTLGRVYLVSFYVLALAFLFGFLYLFPMQARFQNKVKYTLRNAWLISVLALPWTLLALLLDGVLIYISFFMDPRAFQAAIFIWCVAGFGVVACLNSYLFRRAFAKVAPKYYEPVPDAGRAQGAIFTDEDHLEQDLMVQESSFSDPNWNRREEPPRQTEHRKKRRR